MLKPVRPEPSPSQLVSAVRAAGGDQVQRRRQVVVMVERHLGVAGRIVHWRRGGIRNLATAGREQQRGWKAPCLDRGHPSSRVGASRSGLQVPFTKSEVSVKLQAGERVCRSMARAAARSAVPGLRALGVAAREWGKRPLAGKIAPDVAAAGQLSEAAARAKAAMACGRGLRSLAGSAGSTPYRPIWNVIPWFHS